MDERLLQMEMTLKCYDVTIIEREFIVMGDCNVRIGVRIHSKNVGRYEEDRYNGNGSRLIGMCESTSPKIWMAFITTKVSTKKQDCVIYNQNKKFSVQDIRVHRGYECGIDQYLLEATVRFLICNK